MPRGKQKGYKKNSIKIQDTVMDPYYILNEDRQFILMKKGSSIAQGYFNTLAGALKATVREVNLETNTQKTFTLKQYISEFEKVNNSILEAVDL